MTTYLERRAGRVLLVDDAGRVLLLHGRDPARPGHHYWFTPGGGLDPGESAVAGAARELAEETGLRLPPAALGEPVWREVTEFPFDGRWYRQEQEFFLVRVPSWAPDTSGFDEIERNTIDAHRWWAPAELAATGERFYPAELVSVLRAALDAAAGAGPASGSAAAGSGPSGPASGSAASGSGPAGPAFGSAASGSAAAAGRVAGRDGC
ncbi:NUDIX hydrolase [Plantactinospora siamensis]|uniref:NUDIX hydrolase n=1 Tax=Plantactinospora siamensis TaxID=555372 RepID=A0ABV6NSW8_9ACTN